MFTRGEFDVVAIVDAPNRDAIMGLTLVIQASAAITWLPMLEGLDMEEVVAAV